MSNYTQRNTLIALMIALLCLGSYIYIERNKTIKKTKQVIHRIADWCKKRVTFPPETRKDRYER